MRATLVAISHYSEAVISFSFQPERRLDYTAGQFVEISLPSATSVLPDDMARRWFTLSSSPTEKYLTITVRYGGPRSSFKQALRSLPIGSKVHVSDALGDFVLPLDPSIPLIWLSAGIGITPFRSMAVWIADNHEKRQVSLFRKISVVDELLFADSLRQAGVQEPALQAANYHGQGLALAVVKAIPDAASSLFYVAGPDSFVSDTSNGLKTAGVAAPSIITDTFIGYS